MQLAVLAAKEQPTQGQFERLVNEVPAWKVLDQIDALTPAQHQRLQCFWDRLWADEEKKSSVGYPEDFRIRTLAEQLEFWQQYYPGFDSSHVLALAEVSLSTGAEGWAVTPKPTRIMGSDSEAYHGALDRMLKLLAGQCKFENWQKGTLSPEHLRLVQRTMLAHKELDELPGDFWVFPFQFGQRWAGKSVRRGRILYTEPEFGLGPYENAALLATHPGRITGLGQLRIDCPGCVYSPDADGQFDDCLDFSWNQGDDGLSLRYYHLGIANPGFGGVSGFRRPRS
ncbi:MAG: hypothetical protein HQ530_04285 [Parcubacteria group bacterium]|nr:hypothetical protein [Parcubacteria group bacterium]